MIISSCIAVYVKYMHKPGNYVIVAHGMNLPTMPVREGNIYKNSSSCNI